MNIKDRVVSKQRFFAHLRALAASKKTGTLIVSEPGVDRRLYFEEGNVVAATSTLREESMGYLLAERDIVKANKVKQAEDLLGNKASLLGRKLVELGAMSEDEIGNAVRLKVRETISNILASPEAEITLNDEKFPDVDRVPVAIDIGKLLTAGIEASKKKAVPRDTGETLAVGATEETITLEPEPEEELALPASPESRVDETDDPDSHLMEALEGFTERYSREAAPGPRTAGPVTRPYAVVPERRSSSAKSRRSSGPPVGTIAAGVLGVALLGGGYWFFTRSPEGSGTKAIERAEVPAMESQAAPREPAEATTPPAPATETDEAPPAEVRSASNSAPATPKAAPPAASPQPVKPSPTPSRSSPPPARPSPPPARQPAPENAAAPPPRAAAAPARPAPRQQAPVPAQTDPAPRNAAPEPPAAPPTAETVPASPPPAEANPNTPPSSAQPAVPPPAAAEPAQQAQGGEGGWGGAVFAPKQATSSTPSNSPGLQTGDYVEPSFNVIEPVLIEHPELKYPDEAKRQKIPEAVVRVRVLVDHTGAVQEAKIERGAGHGFDEVALAAASQARFIPATKDHVQVKTWTIIPMIFRLDD